VAPKIVGFFRERFVGRIRGRGVWIAIPADSWANRPLVPNRLLFGTLHQRLTAMRPWPQGMQRAIGHRPKKAAEEPSASWLRWSSLLGNM
jgi:hypothetical protein